MVYFYFYSSFYSFFSFICFRVCYSEVIFYLICCFFYFCIFFPLFECFKVGNSISFININISLLYLVFSYFFSSFSRVCNNYFAMLIVYIFISFIIQTIDKYVILMNIITTKSCWKILKQNCCTFSILLKKEDICRILQIWVSNKSLIYKILLRCMVFIYLYKEILVLNHLVMI